MMTENYQKLDFEITKIANVVMGWVDSPSIYYRPKLFKDGNKWCALYGNNLQDGVAGFGDSPAEAMADFDDAWWGKD